jgi:hypothetical protein
MSILDRAAWSLILGLSLMIVGGLMLWAYGSRRRSSMPPNFTGPEAESARYFHHELANWFFFYGVATIIIGVALILWASSVLL